MPAVSFVALNEPLEDNVLMDQVEINDAVRFGISIVGSSGITIRRSTFSRAGLHGIWVSPQPASRGLHIENNRFVGIRSNGAMLSALPPDGGDPLVVNTVTVNLFDHDHNAAAYHVCGASGHDPCPGGELDIEQHSDSFLIADNEFRHGALDEDPSLGDDLHIAVVEVAPLDIHAITVEHNFFHKMSSGAVAIDSPSVAPEVRMADNGLIASDKTKAMLNLVKENAVRPVILVVGGGAIGSGAHALYDDDEVQTLGTDVYASCNTQVLADGHHLPFKCEVFDGVWIQAVLEHVLEPQMVTDEIFRTLKPGGYVYADTPFMFQVHEGAYDFMRFTQNGHRWLFRRFEQIDAGTVAGPGVALINSIRYLVRALGFPDKVATLSALPFFWLRFLDRMARRRPGADAASSIFFFGRKSEATLGPKEMVSYYEAQR
jgi:SAM-dependent methyltransferase